MTEHRSKTPFGQRHYVLQDTAVLVTGDIPFRGRFEAAIAFKDLSNVPERLWLRGSYFGVGIFFGVIGLLGYMIETVIVGMDGWSTACLFTLMWAFVGLVLLIVGLRTYEVIRYKNRVGVPVLDVFPDGPDRASFDAFHAELSKHIPHGT